MSTTKTAKKVMYAAIGAGGLAAERARTLPKQASVLPQQIGRRLTTLSGQVAERAGSVQGLLKADTLPLDPKRAAKLAAESRERLAKSLTDSRKRGQKFYTQLSKRGEKLVKRIEKRAATQRAVEQTKVARARVKGAATAVRKATKANVEAAQTAVEVVAEQVG